MVSAGTGKLQSDHHHQHTDAEYNKGNSNLFKQTSIHWSFESSILANIEQQQIVEMHLHPSFHHHP